MHENGIDGLADIDIINHLDILSIKKVKCDTTTSKGSRTFNGYMQPLFDFEGKEYGSDYSIVTPWDIVMKTVNIRSCLG